MSKYIRILTLSLIVCLTFSCSSTKFHANYVKTELYFGMSKKNGVVTEQEWKGFKANILSKKFSGYTEVNSKGFWTNPKGETVSENSKLIIYLNKGTASDSIAIAYVIDNYKVKFDQESVLKINTPVKAVFQ